MSPPDAPSSRFADGVRLAYSDRGSGPPVVLVHGGGCDTRSLAPLADHLVGRHRVLMPHLRGHGASDAPEGDYTLELVADDVAWLCRELDCNGAGVVGHSFGGMVAFVMGARHPDVAGAVAAIDSPLVVDAATRAHFAALLSSHQDADDAAQLRASTAAALGPGVAQEIRDGVVAAQARTPRHIMQAVHRLAWTSDLTPHLRACRVPALFIGATIPTDVAALRALCPPVMVGQVVGSGHFAPLEVPDQVNAMLDRFFELVRAGEAP